MPPMTVTEAVATRRTIRVYENRPVERALLESVLAKAQMAPSSTNLQPWRGVVLAGEPLARLSAELLAAGPAEPEYAVNPPGTPQRYIARREALMAERMAALGIARGDMAARNAYARQNYAFWGAPACLFAFVPRALGPAHWASVALWLQTVMLLLTEAGLGSCPQESLANFPLPIKAACGIDDAEYFLWCGLAIGWPDWSAPVNQYSRPRVGFEECVDFRGF